MKRVSKIKEENRELQQLTKSQEDQHRVLFDMNLELQENLLRLKSGKAKSAPKIPKNERSWREID